MASELPSSKKSFLQDAVSVMSSNAFILAMTFVSGIVLARQLGPEGKGIFAAILVFPSLLTSLVDLGIRQATVYQLGKKEHAEGDVIAVTLFFLFVSSLLGVSVCAAIYLWIDNPNFTWLLVTLALLSIPVRLITAYAKGILLGKEQVQRFARISWVPSLLRFVGFLLLVWLAGLYVAGALIATLASSAVIAVYSLWLVSRYASLRPRFIPKLAKQMLSLGVVYAAALFLLGLNYKVDIILLERLSTVEEVGQYTQGVGLAELLWELPAALGVVIFSRGANAKDSRAFSLSVAKLMRVTLLVATVGSFFLAWGAVYFVPLVYGPEFTPSVRVIHLLLPGIVAFTVYKVLNMDLASKGRPSISMLAAAPAVLLNVVLNLYLIPAYGASGAAFASTISYLVGALLFILVYSRTLRLPLTEIFRYQRSDFDFVSKLLARVR